MEQENQNDLEPEVSLESSNQHEKKGSVIVTLILSVGVIVVGVLAFKYLEANKVEATKSEVEKYTPTVDIELAKRVNFTPNITLQGEVMPATQTEIISEVTGASVEVSGKLEVGSVIEAGEVIVRVDDADYRAQLANAQSTLADAELTLAQEKARAEQSMRDWAKLGNGKLASDLVQRLPQVKRAEAMITAAKAAIAKADRDVKKTIIRAPYRCVVDQKFIDQGAYISAMGKIASVYSVSDYEVRLPVSLDELNFLPANKGLGMKVDLSAVVGSKLLRWKGKVVRFEGGIDTKTFSMIMVVSIQANTDPGLFKFPPKGLFVDAELSGEELRQVIKIPRVAMREGGKVWTLSEKNTLKTVDVELVRAEKDYLYIQSALNEGAQVILSPIAVPVEGMELMQESVESTQEDKPLN